jgi:maltose-binding protein MalE
VTERKTSKEHRFEVQISFSGLDKGERFSMVPDDWTGTHVTSGYLRDVTDEPTAAEALAGAEPPEADPEKVEEARSAGHESQG